MAEHIRPRDAVATLAGIDAFLPRLETLYKDIHAHPELSMQETRTAGVAADELRKAGFGRRGLMLCAALHGHPARLAVADRPPVGAQASGITICGRRGRRGLRYVGIGIRLREGRAERDEFPRRRTPA